MPTGYQIKEQDKLYYLTLQVVEWVDTEYYVACATKQILSPHPCLTTHRNGNWSSTERSSIFTRQKYRDIIIENLKFCQKNKDLEIYAYVVMSNHIHLLAKSGIGHLSDTLRDFKSFTSKEILKQIEESGESRREWMLKVFKSAAAKHQRNSEYQFWTHENHAEHVYSNKFIDQKVNYIHENPVRAGLVAKAEDYLYSSAISYAGQSGLLSVEIIRPGVESGGWKTGGWESGGWKRV